MSKWCLSLGNPPEADPEQVFNSRWFICEVVQGNTGMGTDADVLEPVTVT